MPSTQHIVEKVQAVLTGQLSVENFQDWFGPYTWNIHLRDGKAIRNLAYSIDLVVSEYTSNDRDDRELREGLESAIRPFVNRVIVVSWKEVDSEPVSQKTCVSTNTAVAGNPPWRLYGSATSQLQFCDVLA